MKLIKETYESQITGSITEAKDGKKEYYIQGIFSTIDAPNRNGRTYPLHIWEKAVAEYQQHINKPTINCLMEIEHPNNRNVVRADEAVAKITELYLSDDKKYVMGKAKLLDNAKADQIRSVIIENIPIAVSSRGVGDCMNGKVTEYTLITYDIVCEPSDYNADNITLAESVGYNNGILESVEYDVVDGVIVEKAQIQESINSENVLTQFRTLLSRF